MDPWQLPRTPEGRAQLEALANRYEQEGKARELGRTLVELAHVYKHIGTGGEDAAWDATVSTALRAVDLLRQTEDRQGLAEALRAAAQPFVQGIDREKFLQEALSISQEIGDPSGEGWAYYALTAADTDSDNPNLALAEECFERANDLEGQAACQMRRACRSRGDAAAMRGASEKYLAAGNVEWAVRTLIVAAWRDVSNGEGLLHEALAVAEERGGSQEQADALRALSEHYDQLRDRNRAQEYALRLDELDVQVHGSRANRLKYEIDLLESVWPMMTKRQKHQAKRDLRRMREELQALESVESNQ
jgi:hypothetical protein